MLAEGIAKMKTGCESPWGVQKIAAVWLPPGCELGPDHAWLAVIHRNLTSACSWLSAVDGLLTAISFVGFFSP